MGYGLEVDVIRAAREMDLLTTPYVFSEQNARDMAKAGADIIVCHLGPDHRRARSARRPRCSLKDCVPLIEAWAKAARAVKADVLVLCHGGPIATPEDAQYILKNCKGCNGFYGASSMERLPTEIALTETTRKFKASREVHHERSTIRTIHPRPDRRRDRRRDRGLAAQLAVPALLQGARASCAPASAARRS